MKATIYLSYVMIAVLLMLAIVCLTVSAADEWLPGNRRYIMGVILLVYAGFRAFRLQKFIRKTQHDES